MRRSARTFVSGNPLAVTVVTATSPGTVSRACVQTARNRFVPFPIGWDQLIVLVVFPGAELLTASNSIVVGEAVPNPPIEKRLIWAWVTAPPVATYAKMPVVPLA